ncbi:MULTISPECIES: hypothetical protein [unclassified Mesorhizobium]|nr:MULTISPECIES: hypothetical protein [unclassified Mesorhizobium]
MASAEKLGIAGLRRDFRLNRAATGLLGASNMVDGSLTKRRIQSRPDV